VRHLQAILPLIDAIITAQSPHQQATVIQKYVRRYVLSSSRATTCLLARLPVLTHAYSHTHTHICSNRWLAKRKANYIRLVYRSGRCEPFQELLRKERAYVNNLECVVEQYLLPLQVPKRHTRERERERVCYTHRC